VFPVLLSGRERRTYPECPRTIPWSLIAPHEEQAQANHEQTLQRLAERGGLDPTELYAVLRDQKWVRVDVGFAVRWLNDVLAHCPRGEGR
jgi:hypothetical protein